VYDDALVRVHGETLPFYLADDETDDDENDDDDEDEVDEEDLDDLEDDLLDGTELEDGPDVSDARDSRSAGR
jgi:hypothetical protein